MTQYVINIGAAPNDGTGTPLRTAFNEINLNFDQVFAAGPVLSNVQIANNTILTLNTNGNLVLAPNGTGVVQSNVSIVPNTSNIRNLGSSTQRWSSLYVQFANISGNLDLAGSFSAADVTITGNLTVIGNTIQVGNIVTDTKTIQLANGAITANAANGSGITVGANDNIATLLYNSTGNVWTTNIGVSSVGNITAPYFFGNGSQLTGIASPYGNANVEALLNGGTFTGNIIPNGNATQSLGNITNQWLDLWVSNATIYLNSIPLGVSNIGVLQFDGNDIVTSGPNVVNSGNIDTSGNIIGGNVVIASGGGVTFADGSIQATAYTNTNVTALLSSGNITTPIVLSGANGNVSAYNMFVGNTIFAPGQVTQVNFGADYVNYFTFSQYNRVSTNVPFDTTGNISAGVNISATGNVTGAYFIGNTFGANVTGEVAVANVVSNPTQANITQVGTLQSLDISGQFTANGNAQFNGDVYFAGNVSLPGNINQISGNSGQFFGNAVTGFGALYAGLPAGYTLLNNEIVQFADNFNGYTQVTHQNINGGDQATGDFVITANNGTDFVNHIDMGIAGSGYNGLLANNSLGTSLYANDGYLYTRGNVTGGNLILGSNQTNGVVRIIANGASNIGDIVATFSANGLSILGNISTASVASPAPVISGFSFNGANIAGANITTTGAVSATGNVTGNYILGNGSQLTSLPAPAVAQDITSVGAMSLMTYDGNLKYTSYATVEPASGNIAGGNISAIGNITAGYFYGDGSNLTGLPAGYSDSNVSTYLASGNNTAGYSTTGNVTANYLQTAAGASSNITGANYINANYFVGDGSLLTNLVVSTSYNDSNVVTLLSAFGSNVVSTTGNVTASYVAGNGSLLTNLPTPAPVVGTTVSGATITPAATDTQYNVTALAEAATFAAPSGSPVDGQKLTIRIIDNATPQTLTWNVIYTVIGTTLPTTTVASKYLYVGCIYNGQSSKWDVVSVAQEA
jgi:hypothetical protein